MWIFLGNVVLTLSEEVREFFDISVESSLMQRVGHSGVFSNPVLHGCSV